MTIEAITEQTQLGESSLSVDRNSGTIRHVKILGSNSANGRSYPKSTIDRAAKMYEGAKVNVNHPAGNPKASRDYQDRLGSLSNVRVKDGGLYGDLRYNPKHPLAEQLAWDAENSPGNVGLSHNIMAKTRRAGSTLIVEEITQVISVDLVADPASTSGLFEHVEQPTTEQLPHDGKSLAESITGAPRLSPGDAKEFARSLTG